MHCPTRTHWLLILGLPFAAACASTPPATSVDAIIEADESMVANCRLLGDVEAMAPSGATQGQEVAGNTAKAEALNKAAQLGATHVVWVGPGSVDPTRAEARAYACANPQAGY